MHWSTNEEIRALRTKLQAKRRIQSNTLLRIASHPKRLSTLATDKQSTISIPTTTTSTDNLQPKQLKRSITGPVNLSTFNSDSTYTFEWLGIYNITKENLISLFSKINFIIICGSSNRAEHISNLVYKLYDNLR